VFFKIVKQNNFATQISEVRFLRCHSLSLRQPRAHSMGPCEKKLKKEKVSARQPITKETSVSFAH
jgi:hypothetical protein